MSESADTSSEIVSTMDACERDNAFCASPGEEVGPKRKSENDFNPLSSSTPVKDMDNEEGKNDGMTPRPSTPLPSAIQSSSLSHHQRCERVTVFSASEKEKTWVEHKSIFNEVNKRNGFTNIFVKKK